MAVVGKIELNDGRTPAAVIEAHRRMWPGKLLS